MGKILTFLLFLTTLSCAFIQKDAKITKVYDPKDLVFVVDEWEIKIQKLTKGPQCRVSIIFGCTFYATAADQWYWFAYSVKNLSAKPRQYSFEASRWDGKTTKLSPTLNLTVKFFNNIDYARFQHRFYDYTTDTNFLKDNSNLNEFEKKWKAKSRILAQGETEEFEALLYLPIYTTLGQIVYSTPIQKEIYTGEWWDIQKAFKNKVLYDFKEPDSYSE